MFKKGIARRWLFNSLGVMILLFTACIAALSFVVQSYAYNGIQMTLIGRSDELPTVLSGSMKTVSEFNAAARSYTENFPDKDLMEVMAVSRSGSILSTSSGFAPDQNQSKPDFESALHSENGYGYWIGKLASGEKVMAVSRVARGANGAVLGAVRYIVSMERADRQITYVVLVLIGIGVLILVLVTLSGIYFVRSIITPIRELNATAEKIAKGDFDVRVKKEKDDELGALCDSINDMAAELGTAEKMKNDFISSVSHELRTPLTAIKGWAETLADEERPDPQTLHKGMEVIGKETERLSGMVEELLDFSRMQSGRMAMVMDRMDLVAELDDAVLMFDQRAAREKIEIRYEEPEDFIIVMGDHNRLKQVFVNILDNAFKHTPGGGAVSISVRRIGEEATVTIADTGEGIKPEDLPQVKTKFYKGDSTKRGSGIGLAVADEIVTRHGGRLEIGSIYQKGTTVTITLPLAGKKSEAEISEIEG